MPLAGGVAAPVVTPLRAFTSNQPLSQIDSGTYVELETETPNCSIYFTTDGSKPTPFQRKIAGREVTFQYKAPFTLRPGRRVLKAVAVHRVTKAESHTVTRTFFVDDLTPTGDADSAIGYDSDLELGSEPHPKHKGSKEAWSEDSVDSFLQKTADQGFAATNHSGTQINLWGGAPGMGWEVKAPGQTNFQGGFHPPQPQPQPQMYPPYMDPNVVNQQQLNSIANQLTQRIDQTRQMTVSEVRTLLKELEATRPKPIEQPQPPPQPKFVEPQVLPVSPGQGDLKAQLQHVYGHLVQYTASDPQFKDAVGQPKMGKVLAAEFDEGDDSYLLTVHLAKPGGASRVKKPVEVKPKPAPPVKASPPPPDPPKPKSLRVKPEDVPKGHEVEEKVRQAREEKAAPIELKTEEKPPEKVESAFFETEEYVQEGTLKPFPGFDADADCQALRKAMKGLGTDEAAIINILGRRSFTQRQAIVLKFKTLFGRDLVKDLESELSGNFLRVSKALCLSPEEYDASELRKAMKGLGTDEDCLIEIICTRTNAQMKAVKECYTKMFPNRDLEKDVASETSSNLKHLLISMLQASRDESKTFDRTLAKQDAQALYDAGEKKWGTDESKFNQILVTRSNPHLRAVFEEYEKLSSKTMEQVIQSEMSGDLRKGFTTVVRCIQNKPAYFAKALQHSMKGLGTDDRILLRIIITRCEIDLVQIKAAFQAEFGKSLGQWIKDDTSGDYMKILLWLCGDQDLITKK